MDICVKKPNFYTQEEILYTMNKKNKKQIQKKNIQPINPDIKSDDQTITLDAIQALIENNNKKNIKRNVLKFIATGIIAGFLAIIGETVFCKISDFANMPQNIKEIQTQLQGMEGKQDSLQTEVDKIKNLGITAKFDSYDTSIKWIIEYLSQNSGLKLSLAEGVSIETEKIDNNVYLVEPTWTGREIIAIDVVSNKAYRADELSYIPLLIPYMEDGQEVYFYGQFNENNHWDGKCIINVYKNDKLTAIMDAVYDDGKRMEYKQVQADSKNGKDVWVISDRKDEDTYNSGETWIYSRKNVPSKKFTMESVEAEYIFDTEDFLTSMDMELMSYYNGNTSDGKYNDETGKAFLVIYADDGTILTLYQGCFKNGTLNDDTYNAWEIARNPKTGADKYMYYRGKFKDGKADAENDDKNIVTENDLSLQRIFEIVNESEIKYQMNWYKY